MRWISPEDRNILSEIEGRNIEPIKIVIEGSNDYEIIKISGDFPQGIELIKEDDGFYYIQGKLGYVPETTTYYFTLQATDLDTGEESEHWYSMEVITLNTEWDNNNKKSLEIFEKQFFQYQYTLINPEGNEVFKKVAGELPEGLILSETGLLYGVPEEDREDVYYFRIGVFRNDKEIFEISENNPLTIKVKDISELNKPVWITDEGILEYVEYNVEKNIQVVAYDFNGRHVYYDMIENNLPKGILWTTNGEDSSKNTGILQGKCETKIIKDDWYIKIKPYILIDEQKIYGDERIFLIVSNAVEKDNLITWITESLEPVKIGYSYNMAIEATSSSKIIFELSSDNLPKGLVLNKNGEIYGTVDYQDIGEYNFYIRAYTTKAYSVKKFTITVEKGFSVNSLDAYLYINKEYQEEYQTMMIPFDRTSAYNNSNKLYKISSSPIISIGTLNTYDNVLLKYKFSQYNTPIEIFMGETKKKSIGVYDLFYKSFDEVNKTSKYYDLKKHTNDETIIENRYDKEFRPGYIRNPYEDNKVKIIFKDLDGNIIVTSDDMEDVRTGKIDDKRYIYYSSNSKDEIIWYYINLDSSAEPLVIQPYYEPLKETYDYAFYGKKFVFLNHSNIKTYIREVPKGTYFEIESKRIIKKDEPIYIKIETLLTGEEVVIKYVLNENDEEKEVDVLDTSEYVSYNPYNENDIDEYIINNKDYDKINYEVNLNNYYSYGSPTITFKTSSINGIRNILNQSINVEKYEGKVLYKIGNQEIIDLNNVKNVYNINVNENGVYEVHFNNELGDESVFYVYHKISDDDYKPIYYKDEESGEYKPLVQREYMLDGEVDYTYYTIYKKGSNIPFNNSLFIFEDGQKIFIENNQWFLLNELENPYIYRAENNLAYGYDKDIVLPNVHDEHVENGVVKFLDIDKEKDYLPEYMIDTDIPFWKPLTEYIVGDEIVYKDYSYICNKNHKSELDFNKKYWDKNESVKKYEPMLPIFFAKPYSHDTILKKINADEKLGHNWYGRKLIFYEIHFEPKYRDADAFTIDFYNNVNENSPEFQLI